MRKAILLTFAAILLLYVGAIALGLRLRSGSLTDLATLGIFPDRPALTSAWHREPPPAAQRDEVEYGGRLFNETPIYLNAYTPSRVACASCHLGGGDAPFASPIVGSAQAYPQFSRRAGRRITLEDRVEECMTRSENGKPLPTGGPEMRALLRYIGWLSTPHPEQKPFVGRGLALLPPVTPDPAHGAAVYAAQCAGCHGDHGQGARRPYPPLWGPEAFNDGAGMDTLPKLAAFIHTNMPANRKGILAPQDAFDVAAFLMAQPRPAFDHANDRF